MSIAQELGLTTEYTTIRAKDNQLVQVDQRISAEHQRILEAAYKAGAQDEREAIAADADWCIQNNLEHLIPERIRARK
jgi:hypothetical protein